LVINGDSYTVEGTWAVGTEGVFNFTPKDAESIWLSIDVGDYDTLPYRAKRMV